jgi:hypothetical protein
LVGAIRRDLETLPKDGDLAKRSVKVLDYMRGYIAAVEAEQVEAVAEYETIAYRVKRKNIMAAKNAAS